MRLRLTRLSCYRYIELNPLTAGLVPAPAQYPWSSYSWHAWGKPNALMTDHPLYDPLGDSSERRQFAYRDLFKHQIPEVEIHQIRECIAYNYPLGNNRFRDQIETLRYEFHNA